MAAQLTATNGASARGDTAWRKRAHTSLPTPLSPRNSTWLSIRATLRRSTSIARIAGDTPRLPSLRAVSAAIRSRSLATSSSAAKGLVM